MQCNNLLIVCGVVACGGGDIVVLKSTTNGFPFRFICCVWIPNTRPLGCRDVKIQELSN